MICAGEMRWKLGEHTIDNEYNRIHHGNRQIQYTQQQHKKCTKNNNKTHKTKHSQGVAVEKSVTGLTRLNLTPLRSVLSNFRHVGPPAVSLALPADRAASGTT